MKIYSYVVKSDSGFAPNPFWGYCTLATCKPVIRRTAKKGDWVIGTGSVKNVGHNKLIYAMKVTEVMPLEDYWDDKRFAKKKPGKRIKESVGDNIYYRDEEGIGQHFPSIHSYSDREDLKSKCHDLKGKNVLISQSGNFYYFGRNAPKIPESLLCLIKRGPSHKCNFPQDVVNEFLRWTQEKKLGINGYPCGYSEQRKSCIERKDKYKSRSRK